MPLRSCDAGGDTEVLTGKPGLPNDGKRRDRLREKYCSGCVIITQKLRRSSSSVWTADRFYIHLGTYSRVVETGVACALAARGGRPCAAACSAAWRKAGIFTGAHEILALWEVGRGFAAPPAFSSFGPTIHPSIPHPQLETPASPAKGSPSKYIIQPYLTGLLLVCLLCVQAAGLDFSTRLGPS